MEGLPNSTPPENNTNTFIDTLKASRTKGGIKDKDALSRLKDLKENPDLKQERKELEDGVFDRIDSLHPKLNSGINQEESDDLRFYLSLAYQLEMDNIAEVKQYLDAVKRALPEPEKKPEPKPKTVSRRRFVAGLAAGLAGGALLPEAINTLIPSPKPISTTFIKPTLEPNPTTKPVSPTQTATTEARATTSPSPTKALSQVRLPFLDQKQLPPSYTPSPSSSASPSPSLTATEKPRPSPATKPTQPPAPTVAPTKESEKTQENLFTLTKEQKEQIDNIQVGFNIHNLAYYPDGEIDAALQEVKRLNGNVVRVFIANSSLPDGQVAQKLQNLLQKGQKYEISFIISTINWYDSGNYPQSLDKKKYVSPPRDPNFQTLRILNYDFFNSGYKDTYLKYLQTIVSLNKDAPNIYSWEIGNELRIEKSDSNPDQTNKRTGTFINFARDVSHFIKGIDSKHKISTGFLRASHVLDEDDSQPNPNAAKNLYEQLTDVDIISVVSYHGDFKGDADIKAAQELGKDAMLTELGYNNGPCENCTTSQPVTDRAVRYFEGLAQWQKRGVKLASIWGFIPKTISRDTGDGDHFLGMDKLFHKDYDSLANLLMRVTK